MPDAKKVEKAAQMVVSPLKSIALYRYDSPWPEHESSRETMARGKHKSDFADLQKTAKGTAATLGQGAATVIKDQSHIQRNMDTIKKLYESYEKPFKAEGNTSKITGLLMEVNAAVRYWQEVVKELNR